MHQLSGLLYLIDKLTRINACVAEISDITLKFAKKKDFFHMTRAETNEYLGETIKNALSYRQEQAKRVQATKNLSQTWGERVADRFWSDLDASVFSMETMNKMRHLIDDPVQGLRRLANAIADRILDDNEKDPVKNIRKVLPSDWARVVDKAIPDTILSSDDLAALRMRYDDVGILVDNIPPIPMSELESKGMLSFLFHATERATMLMTC